MKARSWVGFVVALVLALTSCGEPTSEEVAADLAELKEAVNTELRAMADGLREAGMSVEDGQGHLTSEGMSTYAAIDYSASAILGGNGSEGEQVQTAAQALEELGWELGHLDLEGSQPGVQLTRDDFRTTIRWTRHGERLLVLELDHADEVEMSSEEPPVERDNAEPIPLD